VVNPLDRSDRADIEAAGKTTVEFSHGTLTVRSPKSRGLGNYIVLGRQGAIDITIEMPELSQVEGSAGYGDIRVDGRLGDTRFKTGAGDIVVDETATLHLASGAGSVAVGHTKGRTEVTTAGDIRLGAIDGEAQIKNQTGRTAIGEVTGPLRVRSANGDITVDLAHSDVGAKTANGNITIGEVISGSVALGTAAGHLDIGIREGTAAWVEASTGFGRVHNSLETTSGPGPTDKAVEIKARTSFGDIAIHRSQST
jgi:DUF4097 and DUF4098 domain-containing protein YvlB